MENKLSITFILILITGFTYFGVSGQEPTHYCLNREIKAACLDFSSTEKTCYTFPSKTGGKRCDVPWKEIPFIETLGSIKQIDQTAANRIHCTKDGCF